MSSHYRPGPTFKAPIVSWPARKRPASPERPQAEPLSPTYAPATATPFTRFFGLPTKTRKARARNNPVKAQHSSKLQHSRKSSQSIDDLAEVAAAVSAATPPIPYTARPTQDAYRGEPHPINTQYANPVKRARSEAGPYTTFSPQAAYHATQGQQHAHWSHRRPGAETDALADAELLLGFANNFAPRRSEPILYQQQHDLDFQHRVQMPPPQHLGSIVYSRPPLADASYLPSPQEAKDEPFIAPLYQGHAAQNVDARREPITTYKYQMQTPPEEMDLQTHNALPHEMEHEDKPRNKRGWPKGKPRGPRKGVTTTVKPKTTSTRRGKKSQASVATPTLPRRHSFSNSGSLTCGIVKATARSQSVPSTYRYEKPKQRSGAGRKGLPRFTKETVCENCKTARESTHGELDQWISCNGCQKWFHSDCAGFKNKGDVRDVDKFFCSACEPAHGATTFVRKSNRAHAAVDYAGLNQGVLKTSDECNEHHYIQPIKDGTFTFQPDTFPRFPPELCSIDYFERMGEFSQPILVPAELNPKHGARTKATSTADVERATAPDDDDVPQDLLDDFEYETVPHDGQDRLDMVIPKDLTVRKVCELVGADWPLEVIDVKEQSTEGGKWNLGKWADYYESEGGDKAIRNVISLEVAGTRLGKLLRRPKLVRQLDLQDSVWPADEARKSVGFYCLMSVEDSYTDFHIDFGGSSVYYHILRGSKTFFFIPPKPKHLKAYEDWNNSPTQNFTFLPDITKECYRVDLSEGDTMLIPSGWIHAVWTPTNSLVIGGNFLTHMQYSMQFRVASIEKANKVSQKFRYPKFQKVMWYAIIKYLKVDPLPQTVKDVFFAGQQFKRDAPIWKDFDAHGVHAVKGSDDYNDRYYSQQEVAGWPELVSYIFRTVMISLDRIEGITSETRKAVTSSIPKGHGDPLELAKDFALWTAWKCGNDPPAWAHPDACLPEKEGADHKKLGAKALRQLERQAAFEAYKNTVGPERQSSRVKSKEMDVEEPIPAIVAAEEPEIVAPKVEATSTSTPATPGSGSATASARKGACEACRKRRTRCRHKSPQTISTPVHTVIIHGADTFEGLPATRPAPPLLPEGYSTGVEAMIGMPTADVGVPDGDGTPTFSVQSGLTNTVKSDRGRSKACADCRKSKRRCVHDENGKVDPFKERQLPVPRASISNKRKASVEHTSDAKRLKEDPEDLTTKPATSALMDNLGTMVPSATQASPLVAATGASPMVGVPAATEQQFDVNGHGKVSSSDGDKQVSSSQPKAMDIAVSPTLRTVMPSIEPPRRRSSARIKSEFLLIGAQPSLITPAAELVKAPVPCAHDPPSLSSASSPLSGADATPEPLVTPRMATFEPLSRHSARQSKAVDRFVPNAFAPIKAPVEVPRKAVAIAPPVTATNGSRRSSTASTVHVNTNGGSRAGRAVSTASQASIKSGKLPKKERADSGQDKIPDGEVREDVVMDEDERYARELASQSFGLRARRSVGV